MNEQWVFVVQNSATGPCYQIAECEMMRDAPRPKRWWGRCVTVAKSVIVYGLAVYGVPCSDLGFIWD